MTLKSECCDITVRVSCLLNGNIAESFVGCTLAKVVLILNERITAVFYTYRFEVSRVQLPLTCTFCV